MQNIFMHASTALELISANIGGNKISKGLFNRSSFLYPVKYVILFVKYIIFVFLAFSSLYFYPHFLPRFLY